MELKKKNKTKPILFQIVKWNDQTSSIFVSPIHYETSPEQLIKKKSDFLKNHICLRLKK